MQGAECPQCKFGTPLVFRKLLELESPNFIHILMGPSTLLRMKILPLVGVRVGGAAPHCVNLGPPYISETTVARKLKLYTHLDGAKFFSGMKTFPLGRAGGVAAPFWDPLISRKVL